MPLYDFKCENENCQAITEVITSSNVESITCEKCGTGSKALRLFPTNTTTILAGKGWEKDGYQK